MRPCGLMELSPAWLCCLATAGWFKKKIHDLLNLYRWRTAIGSEKKLIPFWSPYPNVSEGKLFIAPNSCRVFKCRSRNRSVRRCNFATMSQRKRRGHPLRVLGELTQDFTCTTRKCHRHPRADWTRASFHWFSRSGVEIAAASAGNFDDIGSFYAFAYSSTSCRRFEHKINIYKTAKCKFLATCTSLLFRYSSGHFPSVFSSSKRGIKIDGNFASAQPKRAILRPIFLSDFPFLLGACRRRRASG